MEWEAGSGRRITKEEKRIMKRKERKKINRKKIKKKRKRKGYCG